MISDVIVNGGIYIYRSILLFLLQRYIEKGEVARISIEFLYVPRLGTLRK
jgi:hypothetical protein